MAALKFGPGIGFVDFWGISEHEETDPGMCLEVGGVSHQVLAKPESAETEAGLLCDEGLFREKDKCVCAYCECNLKNLVGDEFCSHVQQCNVLSRLMSCENCNTDMAKMTVSDRRTHVQTCQKKQACPDCNTDMAKMTVSDRRTHVQTCQKKQADAFLIP